MPLTGRTICPHPFFTFITGFFIRIQFLYIKFIFHVCTSLFLKQGYFLPLRKVPDSLSKFSFFSLLYLSLKHHKEKYIKKGCQNRVIYQSLNSHFSHYPTSFDISSESVNIQILSHLLSSLRNYLTFSKSSSEPSYREPSTGGFSCIL